MRDFLTYPAPAGAFPAGLPRPVGVERAVTLAVALWFAVSLVELAGEMGGRPQADAPRVARTHALPPAAVAGVCALPGQRAVAI